MLWRGGKNTCDNDGNLSSDDSTPVVVQDGNQPYKKLMKIIAGKVKRVGAGKVEDSGNKIEQYAGLGRVEVDKGGDKLCRNIQ